MHEQMARVLMSMVVACAAAAAVAAAVLTVWHKLQRHSQCERALVVLYEFRHACATPLRVLRQISDHMALEMQVGLDQPGASQLLMRPTFIETLPTGSEKGLFYALNLGGKNFRLLRCLLGGPEARVVRQEYEEVPIPSSLMLGTSEELFDFIAMRLITFMKQEGPEFHSGCTMDDEIRELGLTISFPIRQTSLNSGTLIKWTNEFKIVDGVGKDVVTMLQSAMARQKGWPQIRVAVLVNDSVGTLAGGHYWNDDVMIGMILRTSTNACYIEGNLPNDIQTKSGKMVINIEWAGFWSSHLPHSDIDEQLDNESANPGEARFEKMTGSIYLGEIVRRVLLRMAKEAKLFGEVTPTKLKQPFILITPEMSKMHADASPYLPVVGKVLRDVFDIEQTELPVRRIVRNVCDVVTRRSARLAAAGIVGILKKIGRDGWSDETGSVRTLDRSCEMKRTIVVVDQGLYEHYIGFNIYLKAALYELLSEAAARKLVIELSKDGSGIGAGILAACHSGSTE